MVDWSYSNLILTMAVAAVSLVYFGLIRKTKASEGKSTFPLIDQTKNRSLFELALQWAIHGLACLIFCVAIASFVEVFASHYLSLEDVFAPNPIELPTAESTLQNQKDKISILNARIEYDKLIVQKVIGDILLLVIILEILSLIKSILTEDNDTAKYVILVAVTSVTRSLVQPQDDISPSGDTIHSAMSEILYGSISVLLLVFAAILAKNFLNDDKK